MSEAVRIECKGYETKDLDDLENFQGDLKKLTKQNAERLRKEILELGFSEPISVWQQDGVNYILNGHQRVTVLQTLAKEGYEIPPLPVSVVHAESYAEAKRKVLALTSQYGQVTEDGLAEFLAEAEIGLEEAMASFSFPEIDLEALRLELEVTEDQVPEPPDDPITTPGELIELGCHRLLCGDAGNPEHVDRLLEGATIQLANCDPPYNVNVEPRSSTAIAAGQSSYPDLSRKMHHQGFDVARGVTDPKKARKKMRAKDRPLQGDFVTDEEFAKRLRSWFQQIARVLEPGRAFYIWGGYANVGNYPPALKECGFYFRQAIIWVKEHAVLTRKDYMGNHEWCFYGWREGAAHKFFGPNNVPDVWSVKKVNPAAMVHLTEKPVELAVRAIQYSSRSGENVLDLFGGSGSTLIAAEQTGRRAFLMEIDPLYCDVIVRRYYNFVGWDKAPAEDRKRWEPQLEVDNDG